MLGRGLARPVKVPGCFIPGFVKTPSLPMASPCTLLGPHIPADSQPSQKTLTAHTVGAGTAQLPSVSTSVCATVCGPWGKAATWAQTRDDKTAVPWASRPGDIPISQLTFTTAAADDGDVIASQGVLSAATSSSTTTVQPVVLRSLRLSYGSSYGSSSFSQGALHGATPLSNGPSTTAWLSQLEVITSATAYLDSSSGVLSGLRFATNWGRAIDTRGNSTSVPVSTLPGATGTLTALPCQPCASAPSDGRPMRLGYVRTASDSARVHSVTLVWVPYSPPPPPPPSPSPPPPPSPPPSPPRPPRLATGTVTGRATARHGVFRHACPFAYAEVVAWVVGRPQASCSGELQSTH